MTKVLKSRYFKNSDVMNDEIGNNLSYIWQSLIWGRDLLVKGLCWRVGNGQKIYAFSDSWIPCLPKFKCIHKPLHLQKMKRSNFILPQVFGTKV